MDLNFFLLITIFLIFISSQTTHILALDNAPLNAVQHFNRYYSLQDLYHFEEKSGEKKENHIEEVSGEDENAEKQALILEKFRVLLGLKRPKSQTPHDGVTENCSPAPSPSFTIDGDPPAPARAPAAPARPHHHPLHHFHQIPPPPKYTHMRNHEKKRVKKVLLAIFVSFGATSLLCVACFFWVCWKLKRQRNSSEGGPKCVNLNSQASVKRVSSDPGPDLFYLDSLQRALEPQPFGLKQNQKELGEKEEEEEESEQEQPLRSESDKAITPVHESEECESSSGDKIVPIEEEAHSSDDDDESFHSLCDSHSSNTRLSNVSQGSFSEKSEILSPKHSNVSPCSLTPPPPPPPPPRPPPSPPLLRIKISPSHSSSSTQMTSRALSSPKLPIASSSPRSSNSSSGSNQTPPKTPVVPVGIPLPPFPPPFLKGNGIAGSVKGPPPPPSLLPQFTPLGKDGAPLPKLKPLHWDKVRAAPDRSMVWDKLRSSSFELDEEMIESLFGYNLQNSMKNEEVKSKTPSPSKHVLEPKRLQNITILSKALNVNIQQVCDALKQGEGLGLRQLEALVKMVPTKEEEAKLSSYKGDINELSSAEQFVKALLNVPLAFSRVEAMLYRETFEDEAVHLRKSFLMLEEACKELRSSRLFLKILEAVLKTGNRMNIGTIRGGARAFKLDALLKLADVKGTDGKTTLLHFVVQEIVRSEGIRVSESIMGKINRKSRGNNVEETEEDYKRMGLDLVSGLGIELCNVKKTATIDLDVLASSVSNLSEGMAKLKHLVEKDPHQKGENFVHSMRSFINYAEKSIKELQEDEHRVLSHFREITEYFHGDVSKDEANPLRIFVIVRDFLGMLDQVCKELRSSKVPSSPSPLAPLCVYSM